MSPYREEGLREPPEPLFDYAEEARSKSKRVRIVGIALLVSFVAFVVASSLIDGPQERDRGLSQLLVYVGISIVMYPLTRLHRWWINRNPDFFARKLAAETELFLTRASGPAPPPACPRSMTDEEAAANLATASREDPIEEVRLGPDEDGRSYADLDRGRRA